MWIWNKPRREEGSGSFLKKAAQKLLLIWTVLVSSPLAQIKRSFLVPLAGSFFSKKNCFLF
jgi:hypothetical protein